jgi:hypothetical protein
LLVIEDVQNHQITHGEILNVNVAHDLHIIEELWRNNNQGFTEFVLKL